MKSCIACARLASATAWRACQATIGSAMLNTSATTEPVASAQRWRCTYLLNAVAQALRTCLHRLARIRSVPGPAPAPRPRDSAAPGRLASVFSTMLSRSPARCARTTAQQRRVGLVRPAASARAPSARAAADRWQDRLLPLRIGLALEPVGLGVGQQFVQHHAERVHVGHGRDRFAADLLRRGVVQREGAHAGARVLDHRLLAVEQLGDAEIEQAHFAGGRHQDVGRLEVAVHDQVGVRVADRIADLLRTGAAALPAACLRLRQ